MSLHRLSPRHRRQLKWAEYYRGRVLDFTRRAEEAEAGDQMMDALQWSVAVLRQRKGLTDAIFDCGCPALEWPEQLLAEMLSKDRKLLE